MTVSAIVHLSLVALFMFSEMRPLHRVAEETIPVEVVIDEKKPDTQPFQPLPEPPKPEPPKPETPALPSATPSASPLAASQPPSPATRVTRRDTQAQPQSPPQQQPQSQTAAPTPAAPSSAPGYTPAEPDVTVKYGVMLGLPGDVPVASSSSAGSKHGEGDTDPAADKLGSTLIEALRRHLKSCSKLPAALSPSDNVAVKLRVQLKPNGRLAAEPALIEGTASMKGVQLMQGAIAALSACQPYAMLPADRYGEWKVLDLSFTPHDFNS